jgi:hypothetical protein
MNMTEDEKVARAIETAQNWQRQMKGLPPMPITTPTNVKPEIEKDADAFLENFLLPVAAVPSGFFTNTLAYLDSQTDSPKEFLFTSLLVAVGTVLRNNVSIHFNNIRVSPNLYALVLGGSGIRKTTALNNAARQPLNKIEAAWNVELPETFGGSSLSKAKLLFPSSGSLEGLLDLMRNSFDGEENHTPQSAGLFIHNEFNSFLAQCNVKYNEGMKDAFIDMYDGYSTKRKIKSENMAVIENPCLNILGASTLEQFQNTVASLDKDSGFLQRFIFSYVPKPTKKSLPLTRLPKADANKESEISSALQKIAAAGATIKQRGIKISLSPDAVKIYEDFYVESQCDLESREKDSPEKSGFLDSYYRRLDIATMKIALIYSMAILTETLDVSDLDQMPEIEIRETPMLAACETVRYFQRNVKYLLTREFRFSQDAQKQKRILDLIQKRNGETTRRDLMHSTKWKTRDLQDVLDSLVGQGAITVSISPTDSGQKSNLIRLCK